MPRMLPDGRRLGAHLPLGDGMVKAVDRAREIGASALQIFADNPTAWRRRAEPPDRAAGVPRAARASSTSSRSRSTPSYLVNLAGPEPTSSSGRSSVLAHELRPAPGFGAPLRQRPHRVARGAGVDGRDRAARRRACAAGAAPTADARRRPDAGDARPRELGRRRVRASARRRRSSAGHRRGDRGAAASPPERVGFCLDTAHAWGAGIDLADPAATMPSWPTSTRRIGLDRLVMIHLNDSKSELGSRLDRHEHSAPGGSARRAWPTCCAIPRLAHATYILETPGMDEGYDAINLGARPRPRRGPAARAAAAGGVRACAAAERGRRRLDRRAGADRRRRGPARPRVDGRAGVSPWPGGPRRRCWCSRPSSGSPTWRPAARGTRTRATTCWCCGRSSATGRPAARTADVDRRLPPRCLVLLPARAGGRARAAATRRWPSSRPSPWRGSPRSASRGGWPRRSAGRSPGVVAGLLMAVSTAAVDESTFIWNPNLIALSSSIALAGAWRAWTTRRPRWWLLAAVGTAVTMQCHVLGVRPAPIVGGAARRGHPAPAGRRRAARPGASARRDRDLPPRATCH